MTDLLFFLSYLPGPFVWLPLAFLLWMMIDCLLNRSDPEWTTWLLLMLFFNILAALVYFVVKYLPRQQGQIAPQYFKRFQQRQALWNAEAAAHNIGKDHQYVELGNLLLDLRLLDRSYKAFTIALEKNDTNLQARWGLAEVALLQKQLEIARDQLKYVIDQQPDFKFGDASAAYGKVLYLMKAYEAAQAHLTEHVKRWTSPESRMIAAEVSLALGDQEAARQHLQALLNGIKGGPQFHYKNNRHFVRKAESMLRRLPNHQEASEGNV